MLFSRSNSHSYGLHGLQALGTPSEAVKQLQIALTELARVTQRPSINPQSVDGEMTDATMSAIAMSFDIVSGELPTWARIGIQGGLLIGANTALGKKTITQYAAPLAAATSLAAAKYLAGHPLPVDPGAGAFAGETPWYQTPIGIGGIVLGAFAIYKIFIADAPRKAA